MILASEPHFRWPRLAALIFACTTIAASISRAQVEPPVTPAFSAITVAVLNFKNNSGMFSLDALEKSIPEMLKTELARSSPHLLVLERQKLETILQEQALGQTGVIDEKTAQTVGQLVGAQYLLTGEIGLTGTRLRIDCHILKVETGQVRGEKVVGRDQKVVNEMVRLLAANILFNLTGEGEYRQNQRLKNYPVSWFLLATALSSVATGVTHWVSHDAHEKYQSATKLDDFDAEYNRANNFRKARNGLAIGTGVLALASASLWLKNHSESNQIFAAATLKKFPRSQAMIIFADGEKIQIGLRLHF
jgi:TolB-like protein